MSTTASQKAKEKAARLAASRDRAATLTPTAPADELPAAPPPANAKPIRSSLDLAPALHDQFDGQARDVVRTYGLKVRGGSARQSILRVLVRRYLADDELGRQLRTVVVDALRRENAT
jgi:hypothetical protein